MQGALSTQVFISTNTQKRHQVLCGLCRRPLGAWNTDPYYFQGRPVHDACYKTAKLKLEIPIDEPQPQAIKPARRQQPKSSSAQAEILQITVAAMRRLEVFTVKQLAHELEITDQTARSRVDKMRAKGQIRRFQTFPYTYQLHRAAVQPER